MKKDIIKYIVKAYWTDGVLEYTDLCRSERYMVICVKRALADGYTVAVEKCLIDKGE